MLIFISSVIFILPSRLNRCWGICLLEEEDWTDETVGRDNHRSNLPNNSLSRDATIEYGCSLLGKKDDMATAESEPP